MPLYEFRCRTCGDTFELRRSMAESDAPASCPGGHDDTVKLLPLVAVGGRASAAPGAPPAAIGGGCCGGACGCG
ncbi:MAG TPA: zinc ribbon domain-containing protein [Acidimicrobiales bacterium]|nr:zinc ribbon domain-containing protein [Acidimicrobiales bacterium]